MYKNPIATNLEVEESQALPSDADEKATLVLQLGRALLSLGSPAHRLEAAMELVANRLGLVGQFFSTPTSLFAALGDGSSQQTFMIRAAPGNVSLAKLSDISDTLAELERDTISVRSAAHRVQTIMDAPCPYGTLLTLGAFAVTGTSVSSLFGGTVADIGTATVAGLVTGLLAMLASRFSTIGRVFEPLTATAVALLAAAFSSLLGGVNIMLVSLAGLIVLIPGLGITVATRELATGQLVSGSSRMAGAVVLFLILGFGVALGAHLGELIFGTAQAPEPRVISSGLRLLLLAPISFSLSILFRARLRDTVFVLIACALALEGGALSNYLLGNQLGASLSAFLVGIAGNLFSRITGRPSSIMHTPGLMLLVPGSIGFRSLTALIDNDILTGVEIGFNALLVAVALTMGMLIASIVLPPKQEL